MRTLFLGAGASAPAGYPIAATLLSEIGRAAEASVYHQFGDAWRTWKQYVKRSPLPIRLILQNGNPEVVLTLPDLAILAVECEDDSRTRRTVEALKKDGSDSSAELDSYFGSDERDAPLSKGDVVLTTNWDPLVERTLSEHGRWFPSDGYGFPRSLLRTDGLHLPLECQKPSEVKVLKLHGCFGWREIDSRLFLEGTQFLDRFGFRCFGHSTPLRDAEEPSNYSPSDPVVAYPSFIKRLDHPVLSAVWAQAADALAASGHVRICCYSLPPSDSAIRTLLLLPLRTRLERNDVSVEIWDRSSDTLKTWTEFLGNKASLRELDISGIGRTRPSNAI
jgi:hypothetical protein